MKRYKLIKKYPGSLDIGTVVEFNENQQINQHSGYWYGKNINDILNYSEFWQEIVEKDYEILSYKYNDRIYNFTENPRNIGTVGFRHYQCSMEGVIDEGSMHRLSLEAPIIYSVKRLSDGEIFTIGDQIGHVAVNNLNVIIKTINITVDICQLNNLNLINCKKLKQSLFTTEDGVDIYENDRYYSIAIKDHDLHPKIKKLFNINKPTLWKIAGPYINPKATEPTSDVLYFSTKEAAEEYILMNKPCLSINDLLKIRIKDYFDDGDIDSFELYFDEVQTLVELKL